MLRIVKVQGLDELEAKLGYSVLVAPAMLDARDTIAKRVMSPRGKRPGVINNVLTLAPNENGAVITTSLNSPRTVGTAWGQKNEGIFRAMSGRVVNKAIQRIEATWAGQQAAAALTDWNSV